MFDHAREIQVILLLLLCCCCEADTGAVANPDAALPFIPCKGYHVRNSPAYRQESRVKFFAEMRNCTVVEGDVWIMMSMGDDTVTWTSYNYYALPAVREITGSLFLFNVKGLVSLDNIFPNLRVIRGLSLVHNYALTVYQNTDLKNIGLSNLMQITRGGIRIVENIALCYANTIDWKLILADSNAPIVIEGNLRDDGCSLRCTDPNATACANLTRSSGTFIPGSDETSLKGPEEDLLAGQTACWDEYHCQQTCPPECPRSCNRTLGICCSEECAGGCTGPGANQCYSCRGFNHQGTCVLDCPDEFYRFMKHRCVDRNFCLSLKPEYDQFSKLRYFKPNNGCCSVDCLPGYEEPPDNPKICVKCTGTCKKRCHGGRVTSLQEAELLTGCNILHGILQVSVRSSVNANFAQRIHDLLSQIEEVTDYVEISFANSFVNLDFLKNLKRIRGQSLYNGRYAMVVFENEHVSTLPTMRYRLQIDQGTVMFQNNPMLCHQKIEDFLAQVDVLEYNDVNDTDSNNQKKQEELSLYSNGQKAICKEVELKIFVTFSSHEDVLVGWDTFNTTDQDERMFLGYRLYYRPVEHMNVSITSDRDACHDSWMMQFVESTEPGTLIQHLKPNQLYAFYVTTNMIYSPGASGGVSKVIYRRTLFGQPGPVLWNSNRVLDEQSIQLTWLPPKEPNGVITHYRVEISPVPDVRPKQRDYCKDPIAHPMRKAAIEPSPASSAAASPLLSTRLTGAEANKQCSSIGCFGCTESVQRTTHDEDDDEEEELLQRMMDSQMMSHGALQPNMEVWNKARMAKPNKPPDKREQWMVEEGAEFENLVHNIVFEKKPHKGSVPNAGSSGEAGEGHDSSMQPANKFTAALRPRVGPRSTDSMHRIPIYLYSCWGDVKDLPEDEDDSPSKTRSRRTIVGTSEENAPVLLKPDQNVTGVTTPKPPASIVLSLSDLDFLDKPNDSKADSDSMLDEMRVHTVNVTQRNITITGLKHFTRYKVAVFACQDVNAEINYCSQQERAVFIRTEAIPANDVINQSTIVLTNQTAGSHFQVAWEAPSDPNGMILSFTVRINDTSLKGEEYNQPKCLAYNSSAGSSPWFRNHRKPGNWSIEVRVETLYGSGPYSAPIWMFVPRPVDPLRSLYIALPVVVFIVFIIVLLATVYGVKQRRHKQEQEMYAIWSKNPDYWSVDLAYTADEWELKRGDLILGDSIGHGTFGVVVKGTCFPIMSHCGEEFTVFAAKMINSTATPAEQHLFLKEATHWKPHLDCAFIVKLFGVVSNGQPAMIIMEFMDHGNLRDYLHKKRKDSDSGMSELTVCEMFEMAGQIGDGMAYLESCNFVHRDLAARNILVSANEICKIGDFGMSRELDAPDDYYRPEGRRMIPVRWMSPEALKDAKFSSRSDVWAYGVVLWEIVTLGEHPYHAKDNPEVYQLVIDGETLLSNLPNDCPLLLHTVMQTCWMYKPADRSTFREQVVRLLPAVTDAFKAMSFVMRTEPPARPLLPPSVSSSHSTTPTPGGLPATAHSTSTTRHPTMDSGYQTNGSSCRYGTTAPGLDDTTTTLLSAVDRMSPSTSTAGTIGTSSPGAVAHSNQATRRRKDKDSPGAGAEDADTTSIGSPRLVGRDLSKRRTSDEEMRPPLCHNNRRPLHSPTHRPPSLPKCTSVPSSTALLSPPLSSPQPAQAHSSYVMFAVGGSPSTSPPGSGSGGVLQCVSEVPVCKQDLVPHGPTANGRSHAVV